MSGIVGIYNLNGTPVDQALLRRMADALAHRGPDGVGYWYWGSIGLGHLMFSTTSEAEHEKQPWADESGHFCLTFDGRVDNRQELLAALKGKRIRLRNDTDAEIVLKSYICWGEACARRILGDFAFALWDGQKDILYCARDILGIRPFFYYFDGFRFIWGSELHQFFVDPSIPREPNEGRIGEFLGGHPKSMDETLFLKIHRLPIANYMIVKRNSLAMVRYWDIAPENQIRYKNPKEYGEHFNYLFKEAVLSRLRCNGPVGADLSGGIDSSSVASMIQFLRNQGLANGNKFETFSLIFPGLPCDESTYINDVVEKWNLCSNSGVIEPIKLELYLDFAKRSLDFPDTPTGDICYWNESWAAHRKGFKVVLTGKGGDNICGLGSCVHYADLLRYGKWVELAHLIYQDWQKQVIRNPGVDFCRFGLKPLIPQIWRTTTKRILLGNKKISYIMPEFAKRVHLYDRLNAKPKCPNILYAFRDFYHSMFDGWAVKGCEMSSRMQAWRGLEYRHPFLDRRLIEYCLALPYDQHRRGKLYKIVLRDAMVDILPESVRNREDKVDFAHLFIDTLKAHNGEMLFKSLVVAKQDWINSDILSKMYRETIRLYEQKIPTYGLMTWQLWLIHGIDMWWRASFPE